jgi:hypothetical protein
MGLTLVQAAWVVTVLVTAGDIPVAAFVLLALADLSVPLVAEAAGSTPWHAHHIAERYGLMLIIVLGEVVLSVTFALQDAFDAAHPPASLWLVVMGGVVYATIRDRGVFRSEDGGVTWSARNTGLAGAVETNFGGAGFNTILIDPQNSLYLHLAAGNGYWYSIDGGEHWTGDNTGFASGDETWVYAIALTPDRRLIAATSEGLYLRSVAPPPEVVSVTPSTGDVGGGTSVTIAGSGFQSGATVLFGERRIRELMEKKPKLAGYVEECRALVKPREKEQARELAALPLVTVAS